MDEQISLGILAIAIGAAFGFVLFVPFVAISYRRRGGLSFGRFVLWGAALIYFWAIWTYTLLPLPDPDAIRCVGTNLDLFQFVDDVRGAVARPGRTLTDPAVLQLLLNVLLFVPLGFFVRVLGGRGILVALAVGLGLSVFIETTQLTGVWGVYPCAYRVFDVDDMLTNTTGAILGSILSLVVPKRHRGMGRAPDADEPRPVTRGRRAVAILCDLIAFGLVYLSAGVVAQVVLTQLGERDAVVAGDTGEVVAALVAALTWLVVILVTGRSIGDLAVQLRYTGGPVPAWLARPLRWMGGISGVTLLGMLPGLWGIAGPLFALASSVLFFTTTAGRGIPGLISGMRVADARDED
ncbi:MAG: VanZ family protein [Microbacterium sp.]